VNANGDGKNKKNHDDLVGIKPPKNGDIDVCDQDGRNHQQPVESVRHNRGSEHYLEGSVK
jgi:hypothetical protein